MKRNGLKLTIAALAVVLVGGFLQVVQKVKQPKKIHLQK